MSVPVITISREFAAGGRSVAKGLSERLGLPWYDRDFVKLTAERSGYSVEDIAREGEALSGNARFWDKVSGSIASYTSSHDMIFEAQRAAVAELAQQPCIIVGRCSNIILHELSIPSFDIFLYADPEVRAKRAVESGLCPEGTDPLKYVQKQDILRENHYRSYTGREMRRPADYTICLNTGEIDYDACADLLAGLIQKR